MTPTHKDLVEALREARSSLISCEHWLKATILVCETEKYPDTASYATKAVNKATATLSKINPILNELEEE